MATRLYLLGGSDFGGLSCPAIGNGCFAVRVGEDSPTPVGAKQCGLAFIMCNHHTGNVTQAPTPLCGYTLTL